MYSQPSFQPAADEGEGVGAADVVLALQREDVRARPRGPLPQDVRAPRQGRGAGPRHGAVHLLRSRVARLHLVTTAGLVTHGPGYSFRRLHRHFSLRLGSLISPSDALGYLYKNCIVMCTFSWVWCGVRIFSAVGYYY